MARRHRHLVGLDIDDRIALGDAIAQCLQPPQTLPVSWIFRPLLLLNNDGLIIDLQNIPNPASNKSYCAWLLSDKNQPLASPILLGTLPVSGRMGAGPLRQLCEQ